MINSFFPKKDTSDPEFSYYKSDLFPKENKNIDSIKKNSKLLIKTALPKLADINFTQTLQILEKVSDYTKVIQDIESEIEISLNYYNALQQNDATKSLSDFYNDLENNKLKLLDNDFVDFWTKRYQLTVEPLKTIIKQNLNIKDDSFFSDLSDSIGLLVNSNCLLDDNVIPFTDITCNLYQAPNTIPVQLRNKTSLITQYISEELSRKTTILFRKNMNNINLTSSDSNPYDTPLTPHGGNLITDINTFQIIKDNINSYYNKLSSSYKKIFSYIEYLSNIKNINGYNPRDNNSFSGTNQQIITNLVFSMNVEKFNQSLDLLQKKIINILSYSTNRNTLSNITTENS
jgi:hypothetical protein